MSGKSKELLDSIRNISTLSSTTRLSEMNRNFTAGTQHRENRNRNKNKIASWAS